VEPRIASPVPPRLFAAAALLAGAATSTGPASAGDPPPVEVPERHAELGRAYHVHTGRDSQVVFTSDAPLEHFKGLSGDVVGYVVAAQDGGATTPALLAGRIVLPVESIDTGVPLRNEHLQSSRWLDADAHPNIEFELRETREIEPLEPRAGFDTYRVTLAGDLTVRGVSRRLETEAILTLMPAGGATRFRGPGDWLRLACEFPINLREYGVNDPAIGIGRVAEAVDVEVNLFLSTEPPTDK